MDIFSAIFLGFIQGITEFLPVSSSGHLVLLHSLLGIEGEGALAFDAILHLATASAVFVYFFDEIGVLIQTVIRRLGRLPVNEKDLVIVKALAIGTLPAIVAGLLLESYMETIFRHPLLVACVLVIGSLFFIFAEYRYQNCYHHREIDVKTGWRIGLFQILALVPGFSRSGATLAGGMILGLSRTDATRFAFLLAIPLLLGAGAKKILELLTVETAVPWGPVLFGAVTAFCIGLIAIHFMITFVRNHSLWVFIWYRIILAGFIIFVWFFG
jgi:undecaprenyl-diphosphatase